MTIFNDLKIFFGFVVFNENTRLPIYTQYNFDFTKYIKDFQLDNIDNIDNIDKYSVFLDFWIRNETRQTSRI
jgi:hypothetical protein